MHNGLHKWIQMNHRLLQSYFQALSCELLIIWSSQDKALCSQDKDYMELNVVALKTPQEVQDVYVTDIFKSH